MTAKRTVEPGMSEYLERIVDNLRRIAVEEDAALARGVVPPIYTSGNVEG